MDRFTGCAFAMVALAVLADLWRTRLTWWEDSGPGPAFLPGVLAALLLVCAIALVVRPPGTSNSGDSEAAVPVAQTVRYAVLVAALILVFPYLGGLLSLGLFVGVELLWVERRSVWVALTASVVVAAVIYLIFVRLLSVPLPAGVLSLPPGMGG